MAGLVQTVIYGVLLLAAGIGGWVLLAGVIVSILKGYSDEKFSKDLTRRIAYGLQVGTVKTLTDVDLLFRALFGNRPENEKRSLLGRALLRGNSWLHHPERREWLRDKKLAVEEIRELSKQFAGLAAENDKVAPFAELPAEERGILTDVMLFLDSGNTAAMKDKLNSLAGIIQAKEKTVRLFVKIKRWTNVVAVLGLIFAVIGAILKFSKII